jgi:hypothetical protein
MFIQQLCLRGTYQTNWQKILDAADLNDDCNVNFFEDKVENMLSDIFTEDECSGGQLHPYLVLKSKIHGHQTSIGSFWHLITTTQQLPNTPDELFSIGEQTHIPLYLFPLKWMTTFVQAGRPLSLL